jgi:DNA-binding transcriptional MerR regulator
MEQAEYLTASDAARLLVMSVDNVRRLTRTGVLKPAARTASPSRPISLYRRADVEALAKVRARPQRTPIPTEKRHRARRG